MARVPVRYRFDRLSLLQRFSWAAVPSSPPVRHHIKHIKLVHEFVRYEHTHLFYSLHGLNILYRVTRGSLRDLAWSGGGGEVQSVWQMELGSKVPNLSWRFIDVAPPSLSMTMLGVVHKHPQEGKERVKPMRTRGRGWQIIIVQWHSMLRPAMLIQQRCFPWKISANARSTIQQL